MERKQPGNGTSNSPETEGEQAKQGPLSVAEILKRNQNDKWKDGNRYDYNPAMRAVMGDIVAQNKHHAPDKPREQATPEELARTGRHAAPEAAAAQQTGERQQPTAEDVAARQAAEARRDMYRQADREMTNEQEREVPLYFWRDDNGNNQFSTTPPVGRPFQQIGNLNASGLPSTHLPGEVRDDDDAAADHEDGDDEQDDDEAPRTNAADRAGTRYWMGVTRIGDWFSRRRRNRENREAAERTRLPNESDEDYEHRMRGTNRRSKWKRILGIGAITAVAGAYLANRAHVFNFADMIDDVTPWDTDREQAQHAQVEADRVAAERKAFVDRFVYHPEEDWALKDNKDHINDFGPFLSPNPDTDGNRFPGYGDFVDNRIVDNQRQFATALSEAGYPGAPRLNDFHGDDEAFSVALNAWADKHTPEQLADMYLDYRNNWLEHKDTKFEILPIDAAYESFYQDRNDGLVKYDRHVDYGGTMVKVTYPNGQEAWLRRDCAQWIRPNAVVPVEQVWAPESNNVWTGGQQAWTGGGQSQNVVGQGQSQIIWKQNWGGGTPGTPENPEIPEIPVVPENPEIPEIPVVPENPETPDESKPADPNQWMAPGRDDMIDSGEGTKPLVSADPHPTPAPAVEQAAPAAPAERAGSGGVPGGVTTPGGETGGRTGGAGNPDSGVGNNNPNPGGGNSTPDTSGRDSNDSSGRAGTPE